MKTDRRAFLAGADTEVRKALAAFPNAVAFGGHSHWPLETTVEVQ